MAAGSNPAVATNSTKGENNGYGASVGDGMGVGQGGLSGSSGDGHGVGETVGDGVGVCNTFAALTSISTSLKLFPIAIAAIAMIGSISVRTRSDLIVNLPGLDLTVSRFVPPSPQRVAITVPGEVNYMYSQEVTFLHGKSTLATSFHLPLAKKSNCDGKVS